MDIKQTPEYKAAQALGDTLNNMGFNERNFAAGIFDLHPTLQQAFVRAIIPSIEAIAQKKADDRNRQAVLICMDIVESGLIGDAYLPLI